MKMILNCLIDICNVSNSLLRRILKGVAENEPCILTDGELQSLADMVKDGIILVDSNKVAYGIYFLLDINEYVGYKCVESSTGYYDLEPIRMKVQDKEILEILKRSTIQEENDVDDPRCTLDWLWEKDFCGTVFENNVRSYRDWSEYMNAPEDSDDNYKKEEVTHE